MFSPSPLRRNDYPRNPWERAGGFINNSTVKNKFPLSASAGGPDASPREARYLRTLGAVSRTPDPNETAGLISMFSLSQPGATLGEPTQ